MLETEDIDDDYFTPASSTSLANIFGKTQKEDGPENESLKYTPPKPAKPEEPKTTQCIFASALLGYKWSDGAYVAQGKLGFAILKIIKTGFHNIVLYDSNKVTLSCATISTTFEVTVKENGYFSYNDNNQIYWCLNTSEDETNKIINLLSTLDVKIKYSLDKAKSPPEITEIEVSASIDQENPKEKESDTDSSVNRRTKISILNRMASMGQSVLPPRAISTEKTSDSSDTNDSNHHKIVRHKPIKSSLKRNSSDKNITECQSLVEAEKLGNSSTVNSTGSGTVSVPLFKYSNGQLMPISNSTIVTSPSNTSINDMSFFFSEQRISNSEVRIKMDRMTDKVEQVLGKLSDLEHNNKNNTSNTFQTEIMQKLLSEYENKMKMYESFIKARGLENHLSEHLVGLVSQDTSINNKHENMNATEKLQRLENQNEEKNKKITALQAEIKLLQNKANETIEKEKSINVELIKEIENLQQDLDKKRDALAISIKKCEGSTEKEEDQDSIGTKIKNIMNDTFRAISTNFENGNMYSGERVKAITATVIKKVTIESLNNL